MCQVTDGGWFSSPFITNTNVMRYFCCAAPDYDCVNEVYDMLDGDSDVCSCGVECDEEDHEIAVSVSQYPSEAYEVRPTNYCPG